MIRRWAQESEGGGGGGGVVCLVTVPDELRSEIGRWSGGGVGEGDGGVGGVGECEEASSDRGTAENIRRLIKSACERGWSCGGLSGGGMGGGGAEGGGGGGGWGGGRVSMVSCDEVEMLIDDERRCPLYYL
jgi:hypothetical protein